MEIRYFLDMCGWNPVYFEYMMMQELYMMSK